MATITTEDLMRMSQGGAAPAATKTTAQLAAEEKAKQEEEKRKAAAIAAAAKPTTPAPVVKPAAVVAPVTKPVTTPVASTGIQQSAANQAKMEAAAAADPKLAAILKASGGTGQTTGLTTAQVQSLSGTKTAEADAAKQLEALKPKADAELRRQQAILDAYKAGNTTLAKQMEAAAPVGGSNPYEQRTAENAAFNAQLLPLLQAIKTAKGTAITPTPEGPVTTAQLTDITKQRTEELATKAATEAATKKQEEANAAEARRQQAIKDAIKSNNPNLATGIQNAGVVKGSNVPNTAPTVSKVETPATATTDELIALSLQRDAESTASKTGTPIDQAAVDKQIKDAVDNYKASQVNTQGAFAAKQIATPEYQARGTPGKLEGVPTGTAQLSPETQAMLDAIKSGQNVSDLYKQQAPGTSAYDLQRQNVQAQSSQQKEEMQKSLKERLAAQGLGTGSGISEKQQRLLDVEAARTEAAGLGQVNIAEASAKEAERMNMINQQYATQERIGTQQFNLGITSMQNDFTSNRMALADQIDDTNKVEQSQMDAAYKQGLAGVEASPESLAAMSDLQFSAYQQGKAGRSYEDYTADRDAQIGYKNALITKLDPDSPTFKDDLNGIYQDLGLETGNVSQPTVVYSKLQGVSATSPEFKNALANTQTWKMQEHVDDRGMFTPDVGVIDNPPAIGTHFQQNGEIFEVTTDVQEETSGENYQYFKAKNMRTGEIITIKASNG